MKRQFLLMRLLLLFALIVGSVNVVGQVVAVNDVLWTEPFKGTNSSTTFSATSSWSDYVNPTTFVSEDKTVLSYSSSIAMLNSATSTNMTDAHVWLQKNNTGYIQVEGIKLYNTTKVKVSWAQTGAAKVTVAYAFDGGSSYSDLSNNSSATSEFTSTELDVSGHTSINLKFYRASNDKNIRIDNLTLKATAVAAVAPIINSDDVDIASDVLAGNISYSISNPNGSTLTATKKSGEWLTVGAVDAVNNKVAFTATENTGAQRTAVVTLTYGTGVGAVTKDVTITQAAAAAKYAVSYTANPSNGTLVIKRGETTVNSGDEVSDGTILTIIATPSDDHDYKLSKWEYKEDGGSWTDGVGTSYTINGKAVEFRATFVARVYHYITWNVNGVEIDIDEVEDGEAISFPAAPAGVPSGYVFKGWVTETNKIVTPTDTDPSANYVTSATSSSDITYFAVMAKTGMTEPSLTKQGSGATFSTGDNIVVVANGTTYAMYQETVSTSYVKNYTFADNAATIAANTKNYFTLTAHSDAWYLGDETNGYLYNSSSNDLKVTPDNKSDWEISWDNSEEAFTIIANSRWLSCRTDLTGDNQNKFRMGGTISNNPSGNAFFDIYKFVPSNVVYSGYCTTATIPVTISSAKYATYCSPHKLDFSGTDVTAYTAKVNGNSVKLTEIENGIVPANAGVVLYCETADTYAIPVTTEDATDYDALDNELIGINERTLVKYDGEGSKKNYILSNEDAGVGFYKATTSGAYLAAHRAYLSTAGVAASRSFLGFDDETTGIETINTNPETVSGVQEYYNLNGQRVANPSKGLYIVNGKKVIINK